MIRAAAKYGAMPHTTPATAMTTAVMSLPCSSLPSSQMRWTGLCFFMQGPSSKLVKANFRSYEKPPSPAALSCKIIAGRR